MIEIKHRHTGAVLFSGEFESLRLAVESAVSARADLSGAYLRDADLSGAYLIDAGQNSRGYRFVGWLHEGVVRILAGCRNFTTAEAREHWSAAHANNPALRAECLAKLDQIEAVATARRWLAQEQAA